MSYTIHFYNFVSGSPVETSGRRTVRHVAAAALSLTFASQPGLSRAETPEDAPIINLGNALIATMKPGTAGAGFTSRYEALKPAFESAYDIPAMLEHSLRGYWTTLPASQRDELENAFEQYIVASYIKGYSLYHGEKLEILPTERHVGNMVVVDTKMIPSNGDAPKQIDYVLAKSADQWKINDILLGGAISKVAVESANFRSLVGDGNASKLIAALQAKIIYLPLTAH